MDPLAPPAIDPNYFGNEADLDLLVHILAYALKLLTTEPLGKQVKGSVVPPQELIDRGHEGLAEYVKQFCGPVYHPVGTAAMLPREDGCVVDADLNVSGTKNLRVVSFIPARA